MNELPGQGAEQGRECADTEQGAPAVDAAQQYCIFRAGGQRLCLPVTEVEEVVELPRLTSIPLSPRFLLGVVYLRGRVVPVVDLAYEHRSAGEAPNRVVVACLRGDGGELRLGIAVDAMAGTHATSEPLRNDEAGPNIPYCTGILRYGDGWVLRLDLQRVLESFPVGVI